MFRPPRRQKMAQQAWHGHGAGRAPADRGTAIRDSYRPPQHITDSAGASVRHSLPHPTAPAQDGQGRLWAGRPFGPEAACEDIQLDRGLPRGKLPLARPDAGARWRQPTSPKAQQHLRSPWHAAPGLRACGAGRLGGPAPASALALRSPPAHPLLRLPPAAGRGVAGGHRGAGVGDQPGGEQHTGRRPAAPCARRSCAGAEAPHARPLCTFLRFGHAPTHPLACTTPSAPDLVC